MSNINPFSLPGQWYKGNLHTHTRFSDGNLSVEETINFYKKRNYNFLAITDHNQITNINQYQSEDFLLIPSMEWNTGKSELGTSYHLLGIDLPYNTILPQNPDTIEIQTAIDFLRNLGAEVIITHPYWSGLVVSDMKNLVNYLGIEVFNFSCVAIGKGLTSVHWDDLLVRNKKCLAVATDDAHFIHSDAGGGWIMLKTEKITIAGIMNALRVGAFYSSSGPTIKNIVNDNVSIKVLCSPVATINFISNLCFGATVISDKEDLTSAEFKLTGNETYVRIECIDHHGRTAWSNPFFIK